MAVDQHTQSWAEKTFPAAENTLHRLNAFTETGGKDA